MKTPSVSAGDAKEHSLEQSAAELRGSIPSPWNPFQGMTEMVSHQLRLRFDNGSAFRRSFSGTLSFLFDKPGVPLHSTPGCNSAAPCGRSLK